jgi:hypothetical protein
MAALVERYHALETELQEASDRLDEQDYEA